MLKKYRLKELITLIIGATLKKIYIRLTPDQNSIGRIKEKNIIAVPKSGCEKIKITGKKTIRYATNNNLTSCILSLLSVINFAKANIPTNFAASDG